MINYHLFPKNDIKNPLAYAIIPMINLSSHITLFTSNNFA